MAKKIFILKAQSLVSKENCTLCFDIDNEIIIPFPVLDELENISHQYTAKGQNARKLLSYLSCFNTRDLTSEKGVVQKNGSILRVVKENSDIEIPLSGLKPIDLKCLQIAKEIQSKNTKTAVILVTKNTALRIKANSIGIKAQNFKDEIYPSLKEQYTGRIECSTSDQKLDEFYKNGYMKVKDIYNYNSYVWMPNVFLLITSLNKKSAIARYDREKNLIVKLNHLDYHPYGITPKNVGHKMMLEALIEDPSAAPLVIIKGGAGTGKTYHSLAVGLEQTIGQKETYSQILISAPTQTVGQERIGFLPGDIEDKCNPHLGGITDNLKQLLCKGDKETDNFNATRDFLFGKAKLEVQPIGFLRGRTIVNTYYIIDETQNIDPDDIKSIVSRAGEGSKFIFLGDPTQIDNPNLNERYNGLVYLSEKMKDNPLAWQITLEDSESVRSTLARIAAQIL